MQSSCHSLGGLKDMLWVERVWAKTQMYRATQLQGTHVSHHDSGTLRKVRMLDTQDTHTQDGLSRQEKTVFFRFRVWGLHRAVI